MNCIHGFLKGYHTESSCHFRNSSILSNCGKSGNFIFQDIQVGMIQWATKRKSIEDFDLFSKNNF